MMVGGRTMTSMRVLAGSLFVLGALLVPAVAMAGIGFPDPSSTSTSPGCFTATGGTCFFALVSLDDFGEFVEDKVDCRQQCRELKNACLGICNTSEQCLKTMGEAFRATEEIYCRNAFLDADDRQRCLDDLDDVDTAFALFVAADKVYARGDTRLDRIEDRENYLGVCGALQTDCRRQCRGVSIDLDNSAVFDRCQDVGGPFGPR